MKQWNSPFNCTIPIKADLHHASPYIRTAVESLSNIIAHNKVCAMKFCAEIIGNLRVNNIQTVCLRCISVFVLKYWCLKLWWELPVFEQVTLGVTLGR